MRVFAFFALCFLVSSAYALPRVEDIQDAVRRGDYTAAENDVREVLVAKPDNAKAHYILAEILAHQGRIAEATRQAASARQLDPDIHFTAPERFRQFETELARAAPRPGSSTTAAPRKGADSASGVSTGMWVLIALVIGTIFFFARRRANPAPGYFGNPGPVLPGMPGAPGYMGTPNYPSSGVGNSVVAGLGGLAAGMVAEHLIEEAMGHHSGIATAAEPLIGNSSQETVQDRPIDFGNGNDWDSGGDSSSSADSGGGFDTGGGDWS